MTTKITKTVDPFDPEGIVQGIIPYFPDDRGKTSYLSYRACGFAEREAIKLANISQRSVQRWRKDDPEFRHLDTQGLSTLRDKVGSNYLRMEFMRNFRLVLDHDNKVLLKKSYNQPLTEDEVRYINRIRSLYTPQQMQAMEMAITPEGLEATGSVNIQVRINGQLVDTEEARRAAARDLLARFASNRNVIEAEVIRDEV